MQTIVIAALDNAGKHRNKEFFHTLLPLTDWSPQSNATVQICQLPCEFKQCLVELEKLINEHQPSHFLLLAQQQSNKQISVEKVALNINDAPTKDNNNQQPQGTLTAQHGPAAYFSNLPVAAIAGTMRHSGIPTQVSYSAGTFVANHAFYGLMHYIKHQNTNLQGGLMLCPLLPQQACLEHDCACISSNQLLEAVKTAVSVSLVHNDNMLRSAGQ
jgi:pyroglutamyl-peptidase